MLNFDNNTLVVKILITSLDVISIAKFPARFLHAWGQNYLNFRRTTKTQCVVPRRGWRRASGGRAPIGILGDRSII